MRLTAQMMKLNPGINAPSPATVEASNKHDRNLESRIQSEVVAWLELRGVFVIRASMRKRSTLTPGTPDLTFCMNGVPTALELKRPGKKPTAEQAAVLAQMQRNGWRTGWFDSSKAAIDFVRGEK